MTENKKGVDIVAWERKIIELDEKMKHILGLTWCTDYPAASPGSTLIDWLHFEDY